MYNLPYGDGDYPVYFADAKSVSIEQHWRSYERKYQSEDAVQLVAFSDANIKYAEKNSNWRHIDEFFFTVGEDGGYVATDAVKHWLTSNKIHMLGITLQQKWLEHNVGKELMPEFRELMRNLSNYCNLSGGLHVHFSATERENKDQELFKRFLINLADYQDICEQDDVSLRQQKSREFFVLDIPSADAYHKDIYDAAVALKELFENVSEFLNAALSYDYFRTREDMVNNTRIVLEHYNKFEIDIPQVEVPDVKFKFTPITHN